MTERTAEIHVWGYADGCPACTSTKNLLDMLGVPYQFHPVERTCWKRESLRNAGFATVPQIFTSDGLHLGDYAWLNSTLRDSLAATVQAV
jgi:glutaredoxin